MSNARFGLRTRVGQIRNIIEGLVATSFDPDAQAFITAANITNETEQSAINTLVVNCKAAGLWTKMKAIYPFVGGTASSHKWNLKDPQDLDAAFRLVFIGGWTHSSTGATPNGTNGYANTFLSPNTNLIVNSSHTSYYSRTLSTAGTQIEMGVFTGPPDKLFHIRVAANYLAGSVASAINFTTTSDGRGFWLGTRRANNDREAYRNGVTQAISTVNDPNDYPIPPIYIGARNLQGTGIDFPSAKECAFASIGDGLTDTEVLVFNQIVEGYQYALGRNVNPVNANYYNTAYNNETNAFLYASEITDNTQKSAVNTLVNDLKTAGIWTKMKAIYPFVGGTSGTHKWNLVNPQNTDAAFRLVFSGGWTHSSTGAKPNGTNAYADTFLTPSTSLSLNSTHVSYYSRTNSNNTEVEIGSSTGPNASDNKIVLEIRTSGISYYNVNASSTYITHADSDSRAFYVANRTASNVINGWRNNAKLASGTVASTGLSTQKIFLGALNQNLINYYSTKECAFASIGDGLTDIEAGDLHAAVEAYNTALARQN